MDHFEVLLEGARELRHDNNMKMTKVVLVFCVIAFGLAVCAWILGLVNSEAMFDGSGRLVGVIVVLGVCGGLIWSLLGGSTGKPGDPSIGNQNETTSSQNGPKF